AQSYYGMLYEVENNITPRQFEFFIAELFKEQGYNAIVTPPASDGGKDIILRDKYGVVTFVECKRYSENNYIGREICQKLLGAMYVCDAQQGIIVTTGKTNKNAKVIVDQVEELNIIDSSGILEMMSNIELCKLNRIMVKIKNIA
ncbi:MAG: restriction endonuclease, partial [Peptostreptococcaceae bacterium]